MNSMTLELFFQSLEENGQASILDLGPICGENIDQLAPRVKKLYVCDAYGTVNRGLKDDQPIEEQWRQLDFEDEVLDGVLAWDLVDHLPDEHARYLMRKCFKMLRSGGVLALMAHSEKSMLQGVNAYVISEGNRLTPKQQVNLDLPVKIRQNREILKLMLPMTPLKSFVYRDGMREFLFRKA